MVLTLGVVALWSAAADVRAAAEGTGVAAVASRVSPVGTVRRISIDCSEPSAEVEQASAPALDQVYEMWMGCGRSRSIGFARSTNGGVTFSKPLLLPDSTASTWDPAIAVGADGVIYASFMTEKDSRMFPVVEASLDHGVSFSQVKELSGVPAGNWGDRDFIAAGPGHTLYLTWDYGPSASDMRYLCAPGGSCSFAAGDVNIVVQKSTDGGRHWGRIVHVSPGFPASGADSGPVLVEPDGRVDVLYQGYEVTNKTTFTLARGHEYFTSSTDGGAKWSKPVRVGPASLDESVKSWWIDGSLGLDAGGNLYATFDAAHRGADVGFLCYSTDNGSTWSQPVRVTPDTDQAVHIVQVSGGPAGQAVIGWLADGPQHGYAMNVRPFSIKAGWLGPAVRVSSALGSSSVWPGDTFGLGELPAHPDHQRIVTSWGSATGGSNRDDIFAAAVGPLG